MRRLRKNKGRKKSSAGSGPSSSAAAAANAAPKDEAAKSSERPHAKEKPPKQSFRQKLLADDARALFQIVSYSPLFVGAWIAGGLALDEVPAFAAATGVIIAVHFFLGTYEREILFVKEMRLLVTAGAVGLLLYLYNLTGQPLLCLVLAFAAACQCGSGFLALRKESQRTPLNVSLQAALLVVAMCCLGIVGINSQTFTYGPAVLLHGLIGFVPGTILAAALIARFAPQFEQAGWRRQREVESEGDEKKIRPASLSVCFSLLLLAGPVLPTALSPLGIIPSTFLITALLFYPLPRLGESFFNGTKPDRLIAVQTTMAAAAGSLLVLVAGALIRISSAMPTVVGG